MPPRSTTHHAASPLAADHLPSSHLLPTTASSPSPPDRDAFSPTICVASPDSSPTVLPTIAIVLLLVWPSFHHHRHRATMPMPHRSCQSCPWPDAELPIPPRRYLPVAGHHDLLPPIGTTADRRMSSSSSSHRAARPSSTSLPPTAPKSPPAQGATAGFHLLPHHHRHHPRPASIVVSSLSESTTGRRHLLPIISFIPWRATIPCLHYRRLSSLPPLMPGVTVLPTGLLIVFSVTVHSSPLIFLP